MRTAPFAVLALVVLTGPAAAQKKSADVVKVSAKADKPDADGKQTVIVTLEVEKPWHVYANPVGNDMLKSAQTTLKAGGKTELVGVDYPAGTLTKDEVVGDYRTYEGNVVLKAVVRRGDGPLTLSVRVQACDDKTCLVPATIKVDVP